MFSHPAVERSKPAAKSLAILVADDAPDVLQSIRRWLLECGHEVFCAATGSDAIGIIKERRVDLVITEVILPNGDGLELINALKKTQPSARVIAHSGGGRYLTGADCLRVAKGLGAHELLMKPASREELLAAIDKVMDELPGHRTAGPVARTAQLSR